MLVSHKSICMSAQLRIKLLSLLMSHRDNSCVGLNNFSSLLAVSLFSEQTCNIVFPDTDGQMVVLILNGYVEAVVQMTIC